MGDRGDGAHGQWGPWAIGTFWPITSLLLDGFLQKFSHIQLKPPQPAQGYFLSLKHGKPIVKHMLKLIEDF